MKINIEHEERVTAAIDEAEGKAQARTLGINRIKDEVEKAERQLSILRIPKKAWIGCKVELRPESVPNSYQHAAHGTHATIQRFSTGWFLVDVSRGYCNKESFGGGKRSFLHLSDEAHAAIPKTQEL